MEGGGDGCTHNKLSFSFLFPFVCVGVPVSLQVLFSLMGRRIGRPLLNTIISIITLCRVKRANYLAAMQREIKSDRLGPINAFNLQIDCHHLFLAFCTKNLVVVRYGRQKDDCIKISLNFNGAICVSY